MVPIDRVGKNQSRVLPGQVVSSLERLLIPQANDDVKRCLRQIRNRRPPVGASIIKVLSSRWLGRTLGLQINQRDVSAQAGAGPRQSQRVLEGPLFAPVDMRTWTLCPIPVPI